MQELSKLTNEAAEKVWRPATLCEIAMIPEWKKHNGTTSPDNSPTSKDHKLQQTIHAQKGKGTQKAYEDKIDQANKRNKRECLT